MRACVHAYVHACTRTRACAILDISLLSFKAYMNIDLKIYYKGEGESERPKAASDSPSPCFNNTLFRYLVNRKNGKI